MTFEPTQTGENLNSSETPQLVAVVDIGATSLRMQIAEIRADHQVHKLESFSQAVSLGKDSFTKGFLESSTIENCVRVLEVYRQKLVEFGITNPQQIRVIATSGVREAANRIAFVDRIFIATGFEIEPFEEAELHRVTFLGVLPFIESQPKYFDGSTLVLEVGGGTSEVLLLEGADVTFSRTYRLGALRLRNTLERFDTSPSQSRLVMENEILQTVKQIKASCPNCNPSSLIAMGGDVRFAAKEIKQTPIGEQLMELKLDDFHAFTHDILRQSPDSLATKFHMSLPDAQSLGPALLTQLLFAREFKTEKFLVANISLRDGLLKEMAAGSGWSESLQEQIVRSAIQTGRKFQFQEEHALHVAKLACSLFNQLHSLHQLPERFRGILQLAALLHDIGLFVNTKSRHKHSSYLILNSEFFGIGSSDLELIALVARYHRGAIPQPTHEGYSTLDRLRRVTVAKLSALLRIAKALDVTQSQRIQAIHCRLLGNRLQIDVADAADISMEILELQQAGELFDNIFGKQVFLTSTDQAE